MTELLDLSVKDIKIPRNVIFVLNNPIQIESTEVVMEDVTGVVSVLKHIYNAVKLQDEMVEL